MSLQNIECCLYELIQCFEGFVKATFLLLLLGLTAVIAMLYSIMNKLAIAEQQRGTASTAELVQLASSADAGGKETTGKSEGKDATKEKNEKGRKPYTEQAKLDDLDKNVEDSKKIDHNELNTGKSQEGSTRAKNLVPSIYEGPEEIPCSLPNPPIEDHKRIKRQPMKICQDGRITKRPSLPRASLMCTPSNCSLNSSTCLSHVPECISNGQLSCRKLARKPSCCSDCCENKVFEILEDH